MAGSDITTAHRDGGTPAKDTTNATTGTGGTARGSTEKKRSQHHIGEKESASKTHVAIAGAVAGLISRFVIAPLDVVKIRLQLQHHSPTTNGTLLLRPLLPLLSSTTTTTNTLKPPLPSPAAAPPGSPIYTSILTSLHQIQRTEGLRALWKGNIPAELLYLLYGTTQFLTFRYFTRLITTLSTPPYTLPIPDPLKNGIAGAAAGAVATTMTYPLDLLRTRFASMGGKGPEGRVYKSLLGGVREIYRTEGWRGYFRGLGAGVVQIVPYMGIFFCTYETLRPLLLTTHTLLFPPSPPSSPNSTTTPHPPPPPTYPDALSGTLSAILAKTTIFPLDLIRKRLQVQGPTRTLYVHKNIPIYTGIVHAAKSIVTGPEGWRGLYKGLTVSLVKAAPASAATMWTFEQAMRGLAWWDPEGGDGGN